MRYFHTYMVVALCAVLPAHAEAALRTVPGLPFPVAPEGMRWTGPVTPGSRNVTLYGTLDEVASQLEDLKLRPEREWPLAIEAVKRSVLPDITSGANGRVRRGGAGVKCAEAGC